MSIPRFIVLFVAFTLLIAIGPVALHYSSFNYLLVNKITTMFIFFSALTFMISISVIITIKKNQAIAAQVFLIGTTVKLLLCMSFAFAYLHVNHVNNGYFLACFFYLYLLNTIFEVYSLLSNLRN